MGRADGLAIAASGAGLTTRVGARSSIAGDGPALFAEACAMWLEGIVSKRRSSPYRSGRSPHWLKAKNPESPAARREALRGLGKEGSVVIKSLASIPISASACARCAA